MSSYVMLQCEVCSKTAKEDEAINWLRVEIAGLDATMIGDRPIEGHYCSAKCLKERLNEELDEEEEFCDYCGYPIEECDCEEVDDYNEDDEDECECGEPDCPNCDPRPRKRPKKRRRSQLVGYDTKRINDYCKEAHAISVSKGWYEEEREMGTVLALIHSEVSEALEADRVGDRVNFEEELADICIRVFDLCGAKGIDLERAIKDKMEYNRKRPRKHGGKSY